MWRGAQSKLVKRVFDFRKTAIRHLISAELRRFFPDSVIVHPPDVCCRLDISRKNPKMARNMCQPLIHYVCSVILEHIEKEEIGFSWCTMASLDAKPF